MPRLRGLGRPRSAWRGLAVIVAVSVLAVGMAALVGRDEDFAVPVHPESTGPAGTKALVELLRALGHDVSVSRGVPSEADSALVLVDRMSEAEREDLLDWVNGGGTVVVADPVSPLTPSVAGQARLPAARPACDLPELAAVNSLEAPATLLYEPFSGATGCFPLEDAFWLVAEPFGEGSIVSLGGPQPFFNRRIDAADNALLAVSLLTARGERRIAVAYPVNGGAVPALDGDVLLEDLVPLRVVLALVQLALGFVVFALWRARRLGAVVSEPQPVQIPGSQLVAASGALLHQARARAAVAQLLRDDLRHRLSRWLGLPPTTPPHTLATGAAARLGLGTASIDRALQGRLPETDADLLELAHQVDSVREAVFGVQGPKQATQPRASQGVSH